MSDNYFIGVRGSLSIGDEFFANRDLYMSCMERIQIGSGVILGERVSIHDENHASGGTHNRSNSYMTQPVVIGDNVWIGANCVIVAGAQIGDRAVIGANSVVTGVVPPDVLAVGAPARPIRDLTS